MTTPTQSPAPLGGDVETKIADMLLNAAANFYAKHGRRRVRIISGAPMISSDDALMFDARQVLFIGDGVVKAMRDLSIPPASARESTAVTLLGIEIEPWMSRDDHADIMREMLTAIGAVDDLRDLDIGAEPSTVSRTPAESRNVIDLANSDRRPASDASAPANSPTSEVANV